MAKINYDLTTQHFSVKIYKSYLQYIAKHFPSIDLSNICERCGLAAEYVFKSDGWVSLEFNDRFMAEIKKEIFDPEFEFKVGQASFSREIMGPVYFIMKSVLTLDEIYNNIWKFPKYFNKVVNFKLIDSKKGRVTIQIKANTEGLSKKEIACLATAMPAIVNNSLGYYSGFSRAKKIDGTKVNAVLVDKLEYNIEIKFPIERSRWVSQAFLPSLAGSLSWMVSYFAGYNGFNPNVVAFAAFFAAFALQFWRRGLELTEAANEAEATLNKLDQQYKMLVDTKISLQRRLSESEAINELTTALIQATSEKDILQNAAEKLTSILEFDRVMIMLRDSNKKFLEVRAYQVGDQSLQRLLPTFTLPIDIPSADPTKVSNIYRNGVPVLIENVLEHLSKLNDESKQLLGASGSKSFVGVPICSASQVHGVILADTFYSDRRLTKEDQQTLMVAGRQIAMALEKQKAQQDTVDAYVQLDTLATSYSRFVPFEAIQLIGFQSVTDISITKGTELNMAIIFCDIRGFTTMSEKMAPAEAMAFLNSYFSELAPVFQQNGGIIDKFIGDGIMALFLDPKNAFKAATQFQLKLNIYNEKHRSGNKRSYIKSGIGIHFGKVLMGAVGYKERLSISVVSDSVNLTSRIDGLTKKFGVDILCSEEAFLESESKENFRMIAHLSVDGRQGLTRVYESFGHLDEETRAIRRQNAGVILDMVNGAEIPPHRFSDFQIKDPVLKYYASKASEVEISKTLKSYAG